MAPRPWTQADTDALKDAHAEGLSLNATAAKIGRPKSVTSRYAAQLGLGWDRTRTAVAAHARHVDAKARRAELQHALLDDAARLREQLFAPCLVHSFGGRDNTYAEHALERPPFADQLKIVQAVGTAIDKSLRLADHDSGASAENARSMLASLGEAMGIQSAT